ncbi:putative Na+/H+ antiporter [Vogesella oryzae]|uniref:putative Na+/H+ antiporter n=1 Tax=Vogesella oryzae TaxID=1735285 RepID=UPI001FEB2329|nr:putative Na+/H+ antiporter [Vogesella oryzae]
MTPSIIQMTGAVLFAIAILHTFSTKFFEHLAHARPTHAGLWHLLGEVEVVFGFWAMILILFMFAVEGQGAAIAYLDSRNFTEPMFVFAIMVIAGTRPILQFAQLGVRGVARLLPLPGALAFYLTTLSLVPLLGSFITEPAAMTLAALILRDRYFARGLSTRLRYVTLGVLFVNISIGGTLTSFAAPPVLMVAGKWHWDMMHMMTTIGWKAALAVGVNALCATWLFRRELAQLAFGKGEAAHGKVPAAMIVLHLLFLVAVVVFAHHPSVFMGLFLFFLGVAHAYQHYQDRLILREGLLVAFFLAGLVVLGGQQQWWLQPVLLSMSSDAVFFGTTLLTAITDNAALTYLGSLVDGLSDAFKYALVTGAVTGGGLTIIANAPNPAGIAILRGHFEDEAVHPLGLLLAAVPPTVVAILAFRLL